MKIEGNQKELDAMVEFHKGNRVEGLRLQEEFAAEFRSVQPLIIYMPKPASLSPPIQTVWVIPPP